MKLIFVTPMFWAFELEFNLGQDSQRKLKWWGGGGGFHSRNCNLVEWLFARKQTPIEQEIINMQTNECIGLRNQGY